MTTVILTGIPGSGKTTVLKRALKLLAGEKEGVEYEHVVYGTVMYEMAERKGFVSSRDELRKLPLKTQEEIQVKAAEKIRGVAEKKNVIVDTHCTVKTPKGFLPGLPKKVLEKLKPSVIVLVETDPEDIIVRRTNDKTRERDVESCGDLDLHQKMNRSIAGTYAVLSGASVKVIKNKQGMLEKASSELAQILRGF